MATKKTAAKKKTAKPAKKATTSPKAAPPKSEAKKTTVKKKAAKKAARKTVTKSKQTTVIAQIDVGWQNSVFIRGEEGGLSWDKGVLMDYSDKGWIWSTRNAPKGLTFKLLLNDEAWADGENCFVESGGTHVSSPSFG